MQVKALRSFEKVFAFAQEYAKQASRGLSRSTLERWDRYLLEGLPERRRLDAELFVEKLAVQPHLPAWRKAAPMLLAAVEKVSAAGPEAVRKFVEAFGIEYVYLHSSFHDPLLKGRAVIVLDHFDRVESVLTEEEDAVIRRLPSHEWPPNKRYVRTTFEAIRAGEHDPEAEIAVG